MSIIDDHKLINCYFISDRKDEITVELEHPNNSKSADDVLDIFLYTFPVDEKNPDYISLLKKVTIDDVYENTVNKFRAERSAFEEAVINIAKVSGDITTISTELSASNLIKIVVNFMDKEYSDQELFAFKLGLFEHEAVQKSKSKTKKANLRKAKTMKEAVQKFLEF